MKWPIYKTDNIKLIVAQGKGQGVPKSAELPFQATFYQSSFVVFNVFYSIMQRILFIIKIFVLEQLRCFLVFRFSFTMLNKKL